MTGGGIALILSGFPRRSETFALNEVLALERRKMLTAIFATKSGDGLPPHPQAKALLDHIQYLPEGTSSFQAKILVQQLHGQSISGIHAYFAHTPTDVAMKAAKLLSVPFGFSIHAKDARKVTPDQLAQRIQAAQCVVACNPDVITDLRKNVTRVALMPHGVDLGCFQPHPTPPTQSLHLLAVGRLVPKKGFDVLLHAALCLSFPFQLQIIGDGPERPQLSALIDRFRLNNRVVLGPSITHVELPAAFANSHIVVVPSVIDRTGDRDGLPNVLLEAMASGRPVVASDVGAIHTAIISDKTGILVPSGDVEALSSALERLARSPELRQRLGQAARDQVKHNFDLQRCTERFCDFIERSYGLGRNQKLL